MEKNTVTLALEVYEEMKRKIERLEKEVQQKTIIKYSRSLNVELIAAAIFVLALVLCTRFI